MIGIKNTMSPEDHGSARIRFDHLLGAIDAVQLEGDAAVQVDSLVTHSRLVSPGSVFFAVPGVKENGSEYIDEAVRRGAAAIVVEGPVSVPTGVTIARVPDCRRAKALVAARFFGEPSHTIPVVGITGTNGKTTTAYMLRSIADYEDGPTSMFGTIQYAVGSRTIAAPNTTPDPIDLQRYLQQSVRLGARLAVMEVSSHALEQGRVDGVDFQAAVFTNLSPEHLDYHRTAEAYLEAKARLFERLSRASLAVVNADDPRSRDILAGTEARVVTFGLEQEADVTARIRRVDIDGISFILSTARGETEVNTRLVGRHNLMNALAASAAAVAMGFSLESVRGGFQLLSGVPGRLESVDCGQDFRVLVDYSHTEDALRNAIGSLRALTRGRIITVFGCGGDRDKAKRPRMGEVVDAMSDYAVVTSDNPRSENPMEIIGEITSAMGHGAKRTVESDRHAAIDMAIRMARGGDIVLIAGKGHEDHQITGQGSVPFDDRAVAREVLWSL